MPYQTWLADAAREAIRNSGVNVGVTEQSGWRTRGSSSFSPVGIVAHHDASSTSSGNAGATGFATTGSSIAPLYNLMVGRNGHIWVIAAGRANHAGSGSWRGVSGNSRMVGICGANNGTGEAWGANQVKVYRHLCAVVLNRLNANTNMLCAHKEWTTRKVDPRGGPFGISRDISSFRQSVANIRSGGSGDIKLGDRILELTDPMLRGEDVKEWQHLLNQWADKRGMRYIVSSKKVARLSTDGFYGDNSRIASSNFVNREMGVETPNPRIGPKSIARMREVLKEQESTRRYNMVIYGERGTPDYGSAAAVHDTRPVGVVTSSKSEVRAALERGEPVVVVGGPAASEFSNADHKIVGQNATDTLVKLGQFAANGWK